MANPTISVLVDTYNHERFIEKAIVSVLQQDFPAGAREIIVVDDGSTDRTPKIVRQFEPQIRYVRKENGGQASAFNAGIPECKGEIIAFLDGDDFWLPRKLSRIAEVFSAHPMVGLVGHAITELLPDGSLRVSAPDRDTRFLVNSPEAAQFFRLRKSFLGTSRMAMRAELARRIIPVPAALVIEADEYLFTLAAVLSEVFILRESLTCYVWHGGNLFVSAGAGTAGLRRKQKVLAALAVLLTEALRERDVSENIIRCIVEIVQAEADQLRLMLDGGSPWQTFRAETKIFEVLHADASGWQYFFRVVSMVPALLMPPRWFYAGRTWLGQNEWYRNLRKDRLPVAQVANIRSSEELKS